MHIYILVWHLLPEFVYFKTKMQKTKYFLIAGSLVLLAIFLSVHSTFAQIPKSFLKFIEKQNRVQSGYVKVQKIDTNNGDTLIRFQKGFFISTPKELKYLVWNQYPKYPNGLNTSCKSAHTFVEANSNILNGDTDYWYTDEIYNAKDGDLFYYPIANGISLEKFENFLYQRIPPKISKENIRYKIIYPDQEQDFLTNINREMEFEKKTFHLIQDDFSVTYDEIGSMSYRVDIFEQHFYDYIHFDILDTISFKYEEIKKGYDKQEAEKQVKKDSIFQENLYDSIVRSVAKNSGIWAENIPQKVQEDTPFFMPEWKFPLLSGDTIYSDSIKSQFLLIDMWYVSCHPCRMAMYELASIDTLYDESLLKMVSINVTDKDTAKISKVIRNINLKSDVACAFNHVYNFEMSKKMGNCQGYPQLYLIDMSTKEVIWHSCGWRQGFTKEIEEIIEKQR